MAVLEYLEPKRVMHFFEEMCAIPHGSGNTKAISDYCVAFAKERGVTMDELWLGGMDSYKKMGMHM